MNDLQRRVNATQATRDRFFDKPFDWSKSATCVHMLRFHAAQMGHDMPKVPEFRTAIGAKKALKGMGFDGIEEMMNYFFVPITPSFMLTGDIMAVPGDAGFSALMVRGSVDKFLGWHEDAEGCTILACDMAAATGAWRL